MRYLNSTRTPSVRLYVYLLLFFGCATNLYTAAALPVTEPDSKGLATRSANTLVPRDRTVTVNWKKLRGAVEVSLDQRWNQRTKERLENGIKLELKDRFSVEVTGFSTDPLTWTGELEAYFEYADGGSFKYGMVKKQEAAARSVYTITIYDSDPSNSKNQPRTLSSFNVEIPHTFVVRTSLESKESGSHAKVFKTEIVDFFNEKFGQSFPPTYPNTNAPRRGPKMELQMDDVLFIGMDDVSSSGTTKFDVISSTGDISYVQRGTIKHVGIASGKLNYNLELTLKSPKSGDSDSKVSTQFSISAQRRSYTGSVPGTSIVPPGSS
ncbi:hypothetical protein C8R42DRAFT_684797 [Lentinula raphanica]|nr:hypothetical protein C8R42DRAFT_684797 [Lentinula raphanica]